MDNIQKIKLLNELMSKATPQNVDFTPHNGNYCVTLLATQPIHTLGDGKNVISKSRVAWKRARQSPPT